jgi:hypothetical protein
MVKRFIAANQIDSGASKQIEACRRAVAEAAESLRRNSRPDTFLGRKTQEPFPAEDPIGREDIQKLIHSEQLQPPKNDQ